MMVVITFFATVGAFIVGMVLGAGLKDVYISRKTCRECRRRLVEFGFHSDGVEYAVVKKNKEKAQ